MAHSVHEALAKACSSGHGASGILAVLIKLESAIGYVPPESIPHIARTLGVTDAQVAGVLSYYPDLHTKPSGRHVVRVCLGEACLANHGGRVLRAVEEYLGIRVGETMPDGRCSLEQVYCVGNCGLSPSMVVDGQLYGRVTPGQVPALLDRYT